MMQVGFSTFLALLMTALVNTAAQATPAITLVPSQIKVHVPPPRNLSFDVEVSNLGTLLGAFDFKILYDSSVVSIGTGDSLGDSLGDPAEGEAIVDAVNESGAFRLIEVSLLDERELKTLQSDAQGNLLDSFRLATLAFVVSAPPAHGNVTGLSFSEVMLADSAGNLIDPVQHFGASIIVPEPASLILFATGLVGIRLSRTLSRIGFRRSTGSRAR